MGVDNEFVKDDELTAYNPADPNIGPDGNPVVPPSAVAKSSAVVVKQEKIVRFRGRPMIMSYEPYAHYVPLHRDKFDVMAYPLLGGLTRGKMGDVFAYLSNTAQDLTEFENLILFGRTDVDEAGESKNHADSVVTVWDMEALQTVSIPADRTVWRSPWAKIPSKDVDKRERVEFIMQLAGQDEGLYDDIMQSLAPLVMTKKPDGVIWWVGDGANGKSTLMDAIYRIFPGQLSSITVKRLTDGRDTPSLNGTLANVVKESSEGRIDDTEVYKAIGTHEDFRVHKFHSQDDMLIRGNLHHIFSGNSIPTFNDKGYSARRRTFIIPFNERFESDPMFEQKTFTPEFFGHLIREICRYAKQIERQGFRYKWSAATLGAKAEYDSEANSAEEYAKALIQEGVVAFDSFLPVRIDYDNWCAENGFVPLGVGNMRRALQTYGYNRISIRGAGSVSTQYRLPNVEPKDLTPYGMMRPGMYTVPGFKPEQPRPKAVDETISPNTHGVGSKW